MLALILLGVRRVPALHATKKHGDEADAENPIGSRSNHSEQPGGDEADAENPIGSRSDHSEQPGSNELKRQSKKHKLLPPGYESLVLFINLIMKAFLVILGIGFRRINKIKKMKHDHKCAVLVMNELIENSLTYAFDPSDSGGAPTPSFNELDFWSIKSVDIQVYAQKEEIRMSMETPILIAAKTGATEMVEKILDEYPVAIQDLDKNQKNVFLLAVENRQAQVFMLLLSRRNIPRERVFGQLDDEGNTALHLAATRSPKVGWGGIRSNLMQAQQELKWCKFVENSMPACFFAQYNKSYQTARDVFVEAHKDLLKGASEWLSKTAESCSVVAVLVASVAFGTASTVPGGINQESGMPVLETKPPFLAFAISSLIALCSSITALVFFLSIITSRHKYEDFAAHLPGKLLIGFTSLFVSILSMLVSFFGGHSIVVRDELRDVTYPLYAVLCLPLAFFFFSRLSLFLDLFRGMIAAVPVNNF